MSENENGQNDLPQDWSASAFPTSARPVFRSVALLLLILALLCFLTYQCSDHSARETKTDLKKKHVQSELLSDDQLPDVPGAK